MRTTTVHCVIGMLALGLTGVATGAEPADSPIDYTKQIKPLLSRYCVSCHGPLRQRGGLRLDAGSLIRKGGDSGPAVVASRPAESLLLHALQGTNDATQMPPEGKPLKKSEIALVHRWIAEGAKSPKNEPIAADPREHWAFKKPVRPAIPKLKDSSWVINPIDAFIAAQHQQHKVKPQIDAQKSVLLRRVYLDLIGLPPTPEQLKAFLADNSADAYEKVVDELLRSPRYGERWGRHWMDVWRYSDWYGYRKELRNSARHIWRWRDWIVESLNNDRPYAEMVADMLAADERAPDDAERLRATGFLARHYYKFNRNVWLDSVVEHTGKAFLGMTFNCARCHDHMYDPVSQREYYRLRAVFEPYRVRTRPVPGEPDTTKDGIPVAYDADLKAKTYVFQRGNDKYPDKENPVSADVPEILKVGPTKITPVRLPASAWYPGTRPEFRRTLLAKAEALVRRRTTEAEKAEQAFRAAQRRRHTATREPARAKQPRSTRQPAAGAAPVLTETFSKPAPELWTFGPGDWKYRDGKLIQSQIDSSRQTIRSKAAVPRDFTARFRFRTTGGAVYKSVGISFDDDGRGNAESVYLSAYARGPKVQVAHVRGGKSSYPRTGAKQLKVEVGRTQELRLAVRDRLLHVWVNGKRTLIYRLPASRRKGTVSLWTFDATAEFLHLEIAPLSTSEQLAGPQTDQPTQSVAGTVVDTIERARKDESVARARLLAARSALASLKARIRADDARYASPAAPDAKQLIAAAARLELIAKRDQAIADVAVAERTLRFAAPNTAKSKKQQAAAKKAEAQARKQLEAARRALLKPANDYAPVSSQYPRSSSGRRLVLARWIADRDNPLTARVAVNHIWMRHFGTPLVSSVFDFGKNGRPPTHPRLLDWLAVEFMDNGWSMKHLHRQIVTSRAYRMSSSTRNGMAGNRKIDPDNRFLWRMNSMRMEAEVVRDSILHVAGRLNLKMGGPELDANLGQTTARRSIYYRHAPEKFMTFLKLFDAASTNECYRRNETVVPQQALALVNSSLALAQSRHLARRIQGQLEQSKRSATDDAFISKLFVTTLCRRPTPSERAVCALFLKKQARRLAAPRVLTKSESGPKVAIPPSEKPDFRARENLTHVLLIHHEFLTRR